MTEKDLETLVDEAESAEVSDIYEPGNERWEMRPLSELIEPVLGKTPKRSEDQYWGGDIQWASAKDISQSKTRHIYDTEENMTEAGKEASNAKILPDGTVVVIARGATMGRVAQLGKPMAFNQTCYALDTNEQLLDDYLYYAWQYVFGQVQAVSYGTVFDTITMKSFKDIEVPVPSVPVQREIAKVLSALDDKVEMNRAVGSTVENMIEVVYQSISETANSSRVEFSEICDTTGGGTPDTDNLEYWEGEVKWLTPKEVTGLDTSVVYDTERKLTEDGLANTSAKVMPKDSTLLYSRGKNVGEVVINKEPMATNQGFICMNPDESIVPEVLLELVKGHRKEIEQLATGSTYPEISQRDLNQIEIPLPEKKAQENFAKVASPGYDYIYSLLIECDLLEEIRDTLLPKLLSGQVRVDE
ncbi:restriction endonuclease subunit S [Haloplanus natans]|uniref:restriction endonuclease subunit S n=1 Tax=Haloplanus natans TaxID=376171 RepID=UPI000A05B9E6|nr:restriction endonuclease subunit S [Haloplanus natans]